MARSSSPSATQVLFVCAALSLAAQLQKKAEIPAQSPQFPPKDLTTSVSPSLDELLSEFKEDTSSDLSFLAELAQKLNDASVHQDINQPNNDMDPHEAIYIPPISSPIDNVGVKLSPAPIEPVPPTSSQRDTEHVRYQSNDQAPVSSVPKTVDPQQQAVALTRQQRVYDTLARQRKVQENVAAARWGGRRRDSFSPTQTHQTDRLVSTADSSSSTETILCVSSEKPTSKDLFVFVHVPKTGGSSFYDTLRWLTMKGSDKPRWYPDKVGGSASFQDEGCGVKSRVGSAHCDFAELEACITARYTGFMPSSAVTLHGGTRKYVTVLRHPVRRVVSEYFFACTTKKRTRRADKMINTPEGPKVLLDWSVPLWKSMDHRKCAEPTHEQFKRWIDHQDNPANGRYARFFLPRAAATGPPFTPGDDGVGMLARPHNCLVGDHDATVRHWNALLVLRNQTLNRSKDNLERSRPLLQPLAALTAIMNRDRTLRAAAQSTLRTRFWFVGVLEKLEQTYDAFCELGRFAMCGTKPPANAAQEHRSKSRPSSNILDSEARTMIEERNRLDLHLYDTAAEALSSSSPAFRHRDRKISKSASGGSDVYHRGQ